MHDYYAARAAEYDRVYLKPERQADLRAIEQWLPERLRGRQVLEVACGTGWWTQFIAPQCRSVVAVDASPQTLEIARRRVTADHVLWLQGDAYALPVALRSFDAAFAGFWWSHVPRARIDTFLQGLHAALQPGARVVFLDNRFVQGSSTPISDTDAQGDTWQTRRLADGSEHRVLKNFPGEQQLREALALHATDVRYRQWDHYWAVEYTV